MPSYHTQDRQCNKPGILEAIGRRVDLRRRGKEFIGRCPFHADKTPSFAVSDSKQVYYCHACGQGGDVIDFAQKIDGLNFTEALKSLGMNGEQPRRPAITPSRQRAAALAASWANQQRAKLNRMIADAMALRDDADEIGAFDVADVVDRELVMLRAFYNSLEYPRGVAEMLMLREGIEGITDSAAVEL